MHTIFSDGRINDISSIVKICNVMAITDHNTIQSNKYYSDILGKVKHFIGCEVTVDASPDYLIYFFSNKYLYDIESNLRELRESEENAIKWCYHDLGYDSWESDKEQSFASYQKIRSMQTKNLAAIIHFYNADLKKLGCQFDLSDLKTARNARRKYRTEVGNTIPVDFAFQLAGKFDGEIVLAHPIHTSIKLCSRDLTNRTVIINKLDKLLESFVEHSGTTIEWEYMSPELLSRYELENDIKAIRQWLWRKANSLSMKYTIGSDAHDIQGQYAARCWLCNSELLLEGKLADWIQ